MDGLLAEWSLGPARVKHVKYEDLVTAPGEQLRKICDFLNVRYSEDMLAYYQSDPARAISVMTHHTNVLKPVFASSIGKYREKLTQAEIGTIQRRLYSPMRSLGYISYEEYDELSCKRH
jgi:hypothetical protein